VIYDYQYRIPSSLRKGLIISKHQRIECEFQLNFARKMTLLEVACAFLVRNQSSAILVWAIIYEKLRMSHMYNYVVFKSRETYQTARIQNEVYVILLLLKSRKSTNSNKSFAL